MRLDLKPANVFLDENNFVRVGDLGLSKILDFTLQQAKTMCGTPAFMAPELCKVRFTALTLRDSSGFVRDDTHGLFPSGTSLPD